jgi:hypothetical protein
MNPTSYSLSGKWDLYYHLPTDSNWDLNSYKPIMKDIQTVLEVLALNDTYNENMVKSNMLFLMKSGISPIWEDPENRNGGCFSFKVANKQVFEVWKSLFYSICGNTICNNDKYKDMINGITISPKKSFCILKVWMNSCENQDSSTIIDIPNLHSQGCLFKKHEPEF